MIRAVSSIVILAAGTDVNPGDSAGDNALWCARDGSHPGIVELLIAAGATE